MILAILFLVLALVLCVAVALAILAATDIYYLSGSRSLMEDGLRRGTLAPSWALPDTTQKVEHSPPKQTPLQLIVFSDHSLKSFPSVAEGLRSLSERTDLDIVLLTRRKNDLVQPTLAMLELEHIRIVYGTPELYAKYNVRVMPFMTFIDALGVIRASSLINHAWQVETLYRLATIPPEPVEAQPLRRARRLQLSWLRT